MSTPSLIRPITLFLLLTFSQAWTAPALPMNDLRFLYHEGEFDRMRASLEDFLKKSGTKAHRMERIFAYKYLGVIYAAEPSGYPLAESYFYQLLKLAPNAHLSDLYVSATVEGVFEKTRRRYLKELSDITEYDEFGNPKGAAQDTGKRHSHTTLSTPQQGQASPGGDSTPARGNPGPRLERRRRVWPWILAAGTAGAVGIFFWLRTLDDDKKKVIDAT